MLEVLIVDDHPMFREALRSAIQFGLPDAEIFEVGSIDAACSLLQVKKEIEIVLLDLSMPGTSGFEGLILLRARFPNIPIMVVSGLEDRRIVHEAIRLGASGFVPKSMNKQSLVEAVSKVLSGSLYLPLEFTQNSSIVRAKATEHDIADRIAELTPAQIRVMQLLCRGLLNKQIACELGVTETTVKAHVSEVLRKLKVASRTQAVVETAGLEFEKILASKPSKD